MKGQKKDSGESLMQLDFLYYATYAAAYLAGYSHEESMAVCYCAQFVDECTKV